MCPREVADFSVQKALALSPGKGSAGVSQCPTVILASGHLDMQVSGFSVSEAQAWGADAPSQGPPQLTGQD